MYNNGYCICEGCLSVDRHLTWVNEEIRMVFCEISGDTFNVNHQVQLCWECAALIKRFISFKQQVNQAKNGIARYFLHNVTTNPLTCLTQSKYTFLTINDIENDHHMTENVVAAIHVKEEQMVENPCDSFDYIGGESGDDKSTIHDIENDPPKNKIRKIRSKTVVDFNESDDEPLKLKVQDVTKTRGKRKKQERKVKKKRGDDRPAGVITNVRVAKKLEQLNVSSDQLEMVMLSWEEVELERQTALQSARFTRHDYRCYECVLGFNHRSKLEDHMKKHDPSSGRCACSVCAVRCRDERALAAHRRRHRLRWRCVWCGALSSRAAVAADHVAREHGAGTPTHTCKLCGHCAPTLGKLRSHLKTHAERQKCEQCGKTFRDKTSLRSHLFIHNGEKEYTCPHCDKKFLFKKAMEIHIVTHQDSALLYCYECDMNFKNQMSYNQHMKYNLKHIDPAKLKYACDTCDKKFAKAVRLEEHKLAVHLKLTPISCTVPGCDFSCSSRPVLRTHVRVSHRAGRPRRDHVCHLCGKTYTSKKSLEGHLRSHSGERPLVCGRCPAAFGYHAALYNHTRLVHLRARSHAQDVTDKHTNAAPT